MPRLQPEAILRVLERHGVRYVVIGGVGATLHGSPLPTHDTDVCPARDSANLEALAAALEDIIRSKEAANREKDKMTLPTLRLLLLKKRERENGPA